MLECTNRGQVSRCSQMSYENLMLPDIDGELVNASLCYYHRKLDKQMLDSSDSIVFSDIDD